MYGMMACNCKHEYIEQANRELYLMHIDDGVNERKCISNSICSHQFLCFDFRYFMVLLIALPFLHPFTIQFKTPKKRLIHSTMISASVETLSVSGFCI